jgi:hypothetical protein
MSRERITFSRRFQLWRYSPTHSQLLVRSNNWNVFSTRIDVLFKNVAAVELAASLEDMSIIEASPDEAFELKSRLGRLIGLGQKLFLIRCSNFSGYVVAGAVFWHEDEGEVSDDSHFEESFFL